MSRKSKYNVTSLKKAVLSEIMSATVNSPIHSQTVATNVGLKGENSWKTIVFVVKALRRDGEPIGSCGAGYFMCDKAHHLIDTIAELERKKAGIEETIALMRTRKAELDAVTQLVASAPAVQDAVVAAVEAKS